MFSKKFQRKYALTDQGVQNTKKGAFWTVIVNLIVMGGMGILYLLMGGFHGNLNRTEASARYGAHYHLDSPVPIFVVHNSSSAVPGHLRTGIQRGENDPS